MREPLEYETSDASLQIGVYMIVNTANWKLYVGSTIASFRSRWNDHIRDLRNNTHGNRYLQEDWVKYGEHYFEFAVLFRCPPECCVEEEQLWINELMVMTKDSRGYNICPVARSSRGVVRTAETRRRIGAASKARMTPAMRENIADKLRGYKHSKETRGKVSAAAIGRKSSRKTTQVRG